MATTIVPTTGTAPAFLQAGPGASPGYNAIDFRRFFFGAPLQEGVIDAGSYEVVQRAAGANMSVDINASTGNGALVQGDSITSQGLYHAPPHSAVINEAITAADATNPRVDQVILEVGDDTHAGGGINLARVRVVTGTATAGATLDNRSGAASLPVSAVRLAGVHVPASDTTISNTQIRDRRPWARGYQVIKKRSSGSITISNTATLAEFDTTNFKVRGEFTGVPVEVIFAPGFLNPAASAFLDLGVFVDGAAHSTALQHQVGQTATNNEPSPTFIWTIDDLSAGSHQISLAAYRTTANWTIGATTTYLARMTVRETVAQNSANNVTTSG